MLSKFTNSGSKDAYAFISEFDELCIIVKIQQLNDAAIKLKLIPFVLKDISKK